MNAIDPSQVGVIIGGGAVALVAAWQSFKSKIAAKATKAVVEQAVANPAVTPDVLASIMSTVLAKVQELTASLATKDSLDLFSARQDAFRLTIMGEIGKISEAGRVVADQFPTFKKELNEKVDAAVAELHVKIAAVDAKIPPTV